MDGKNLVDGSPAAKQLGIYLGQLYGWVKAGKLKNYKADGKYVTPDGKGLIVDIDEALAVWKSSGKKTKTPGEPRAKRATTKRAANGDDGEVGSTPKARRLKTGTIVSYENGHNATRSAAKPTYSLASVLGSTGKLTYLDDGDHRRHFTGAQIDNVVFFTDRMSTMMARGIARVEHPQSVLGMVLLQFIVDERMDLAESLEKWMIKNGVEVIVPEIIEDLSDDDEEEERIVRGKPTMIEEEDNDAD